MAEMSDAFVNRFHVDLEVTLLCSFVVTLGTGVLDTFMDRLDVCLEVLFSLIFQAALRTLILDPLMFVLIMDHKGFSLRLKITKVAKE